jgi:alkaline phosphatase D
MWGNPSAGLPETPGIFTYVNWGDANIYLLDNRTHQAPPQSQPGLFGEPKPYLGKAQIDWLIDQLVWTRSQTIRDRDSYPSRFNLIVMGSQVISQSDNIFNFRNSEEYNYMMDRIAAETD